MDLEQIEGVIRIPLEDTSDVSLLRSRIDQQTHLIAILKQRSDDTLRKVSTMQITSTLAVTISLATPTVTSDYHRNFITMVTICM